MSAKLKTSLAVTVLVAALIFGAVIGWFIKPGAKTNQPVVTSAKVTVSPSAKEIKKADVAVKVVSRGQLSGTAKVDKPPDPDRPDGMTVSVPVSGTITAKYTDAKTGEQIGEDARPLTGETTVQVTGDQVKVDTKFDDEVTFAVDVPEPVKRLWHAGGAISWSDNQFNYHMYIQRDFVLLSGKKADYLAWARGELELGGDGRRVVVGVERRW